MSEIVVRQVRARKDKMAFIKLQWRLYKGDPYWVPPLIMDMKNTLDPSKNALLRLGPSAFFMAYRDDRPVGRIGVGADERLNEAKCRREGYFTLFESVSDYEVAKALFDTALEWLRSKGYNRVTGPQSPSNGDDYRGLLIRGFGSPPVLMDSYNPPFYAEFFERYGFKKQFDRFAFYYDLRGEIVERMERGVEFAMKRYDFHCDRINMKRFMDELKDLKIIIDESHPEWPDMIPPSWEEIESEAGKLMQVIDPDLVWFARTNQDNRPIGLAVALPDYNQVFKKLNGRLFPFGIFKFLWLKRKITGGRSLILFVSPDYHKKGVSAALYIHGLKAAKAKGYVYGEGGTVHEFNDKMVRDALGAGGDLYKTYRIYEKTLEPDSGVANSAR